MNLSKLILTVKLSIWSRSKATSVVLSRNEHFSLKNERDFKNQVCLLSVLVENFHVSQLYKVHVAFMERVSLK